MNKNFERRKLLFNAGLITGSTALFAKSASSSEASFDETCKKSVLITFDDVASMKSGILPTGGTISIEDLASVQARVITKQYSSQNPLVGGAEYVIKRTVDHINETGDPLWIPDTQGHHRLLDSSDYVAILSVREKLSINQCGASSFLTNNLPAIQSAFRIAQENGISTIVGDIGTYNFSAIIGAPGENIEIANDGLTVDFSGITLVDTQTYSGSDEAWLFFLKGANNTTINVNKIVTQHSSILGNLPVDSGLIAILQIEGGNNTRIQFEMDGGLAGYTSRKASTDPDYFTVTNLKCSIKANNCHYPFQLQFSGKNVEANLNVRECGRTYIIYGVSNVRINAISKNPHKAAIATAFEGKGLSNIEIYSVDTNSSIHTNQTAANHTELKFGDETPAEILNVKYFFNIFQNGTIWGTCFKISKYTNSETPDTGSRGHKLIGLEVTGRLESTNDIPILTNGTLTGNDELSNINFHDLYIKGATSTMDFSGLTGQASFKNIDAGEFNFYVVSNQNKNIVFDNVTCGNLTSHQDDKSNHTYRNCTIYPGILQNISGNKTISSTSIAGRNFTHLSNQQNISDNVAIAVKKFVGNLSILQQAFVIKHNTTAGMYRLKYYLVNDQSVFDPSTRSETSGIKSFTATMSSNGVWQLIMPIINEVPQRNHNVSANLIVNLKNGDSNGAIIEVRATGYSNPGSIGIYMLECISFGTVTISVVD